MVGQYRLVAMRGRGGMGEVWEAESSSAEHVAVKLMHQHLVDDPELVQRFEREFQTGKTVRHPALVQMFDHGEHNGVPYIAMELAAGKSLRRLIDKGAPYFTERETAEVGRQMASALGAMHAASIVHRDMKASNIMLDRDLNAKLIDFGIVRMSGRSSFTPHDAMMGTAEYAPPETYFNRKHESASDIYSLGIVMYEMMVGRPPFRGDRYTDVLRQHAELPPPRISAQLPVVSRQLDNLVWAMLQKQPGKRPTPAQVEAGCRSLLTSARPPAAPVAPLPRALPPRQPDLDRTPPQWPTAQPAQGVRSGRPSPVAFLLVGLAAVLVVIATASAALVAGA